MKISFNTGINKNLRKTVISKYGSLTYEPPDEKFQVLRKF